MLERVSKSVRHFAAASYLVGLGGCASDGGIGDLATLGAIGGSMIPGVDSGTVAALGAVAVGSMVVAPMLSSDTAPSVPSSAPMANTPASALVAMPISADSKNAVGIGAEVETLTPSMAKALGVNPVKGAMVISVLEPGTKASSGLKPLDVITEVAGQPVASVADLQAATRNMRGGYMAPISVWRDHADKELSVKIVSAPAQPKAQATPVVLPVSPGWGSTSLESGLPQTSFAEWIAQETPQKYEGRSCDYLRQAYARSEQMEAVEQRETKAWGASRKAAISETLANRDCPPMVTNGRGRLAAYLTPMDPIKAARLGMPLKGASVGVVIPGGNAERAGLQRADVIVSVDATPIGDEIEFLVAIGKLPTGSTMALKVWRKSAFINVPVVVGAPL